MYVEFVGGHGFKGVVKYLERGSRTAENPDRVGYFETRNMLADDLESAGREMAITAAMADFIKERAGQKRRGKIKEPVRHFFLSWHQDDQPDRARMLQAADSMLDAMGMKHLQAVIVEHTDTAHKHLHIVVNRVDPDTGLAHSDKYEKRKLQKWALDWEKAHPDERVCAERHENAAARDRGESTKHEPEPKKKQDKERVTATEPDALDKASTSPEDRAKLAAELQRMHREEWAELSASQKREREGQYLRQRAEMSAAFKSDFVNQHRTEARAAYDAVKEAMEPTRRKEWAAQFKRERQELATFDGMGALSRAGYYLKRTRDGSKPPIGHGVLKAFFADASTMQTMRSELTEQHQAERRALSERLNAPAKAAADKVWNDARRVRQGRTEGAHDLPEHIEQLRAVHAVERAELRDRQTQQRDDLKHYQADERHAAGTGYTRPQDRTDSQKSAAAHRGNVERQRAAERARAAAMAKQRPQPEKQAETPRPATAKPSQNQHTEPFARAAAERRKAEETALKHATEQARQQADKTRADDAERVKAAFAPSYAAHTLPDKFKAAAEKAKAAHDAARGKSNKTKGKGGRMMSDFDRTR